MLVSLREVYLPAMIFSIILDYQLAIYFLYLYRKHRKDKIGLNKFLLMFSNIFGIGATSYLFLVIGSFYIPDSYLAESFIRIGISLLQGGILVVLLILLSKPFLTLINSRVVKIASVLSGISVIYLLFFYVKSIGLFPSILIGFIGGGYFLYFQIKLVKLTSGTVHSRLLMTLIGEVIFLIGMLLGSGLSNIPVLFDVRDLFYFVGSYVVNIGLLTIIYGTFKFPGVLEFNWKNNLLKLYVIDARNLYELYSYDFNKLRNLTNEPESRSNTEKNNKIQSIGVVGISDVFDEITKTYQNRVKIIKYGNFSILLEYERDSKSQFLFVLFVDKNMKSLQLFLKKVKSQFLNSYGGLLANFDIVDRFRETIFSGFDVILQNILD
ncbi:MAG: hypothetical protein E3J90_08675 [Promethearchaeota archaeon]|nr:MAG: hypothetical protein E3J90_08675 [Candidatus Lokiarchaeota archaeon]